MSLGYLPDDEENPIEGPAVPGSADDFIAGVNAQPLAAPIAPEITDETAWPPPVPAEAPGMVPPPVPGAPIQPPGAPVQPAPGPTDAAPPATGSIADITGAAGASEKARAASDQAQIDLMASGAPANAQLADIAKEKRENAILQQADNEDAMRKYDAADAEAQKQIAQAQEAKRNFKFKDFWADKSTARRIGSALAVAFGAYGAAMTHTQNYALDILNKEMDDDHRRQVEDLQRLNDNEVMAKTGLQDARAARVRALQDIGLKAADADKVIAAKADEVAAISRDEQQKAALSAFAAKLRQDAADKTLQTRIGLRNAILAGQAGTLKNENLQAQTRLLNAKSGKLAGAGVAGAKNDAAIAELARMAEQPGVTQADLVAKATQLGIKKPLDVVVKVAKDPEKIAAAAHLAEEKEAAAEVRDANGNVLGVASTPRAAAPLNAMVAASKNYKDAIQAYRDHILEHGRLVNPLSDAYKERERLHADVVAKGRPFAQLGVSNANLDLEHKIIGGSGTGFSRMSSPESLDKLANEVDQITNARVKTALRAPQHGGGSAPAGQSAAAPASPAMVTIRNAKTGETKQVTREQAKAMGAL